MRDAGDLANPPLVIAATATRHEAEIEAAHDAQGTVQSLVAVDVVNRLALEGEGLVLRAQVDLRAALDHL